MRPASSSSGAALGSGVEAGDGSGVGVAAAVGAGEGVAVGTGGIAYNPFTAKTLTEYLGWIAPVTTYPGEDELLALCQGALRVMTGEEEAKNY